MTRASNLDKTGMRIVRKGCTVDYAGLRFYVKRVRLGHVYGETLIQRRTVSTACASVLVVA